MEHIEQAGVHSGDSACSLPPFSLSPELQGELRRQTVAMAHGLNVVGLMNVAVRDPVSRGQWRQGRCLRARGQSAGIADGALCVQGDRQAAGEDRRAMHGRPDAEEPGYRGEVVPPYYSVKEAVFPFIKFPGVDTILGPEMKSTGEVMGVGETFAEAFLKSQLAAGVRLPKSGNVFVSVKNPDKARVLDVARTLVGLGSRWWLRAARRRRSRRPVCR